MDNLIIVKLTCGLSLVPACMVFIYNRPIGRLEGQAQLFIIREGIPEASGSKEE